MSIVERVLYVTANSAWNLECTLAYCDQFKKLAAPLAADGRQWASFVDVRKWDMLTPDSLEPFNENTKWASANNRTHAAIVSVDDPIDEWLRDKLLENTPVESRFFQTRRDAWEWLQALGFCEEVPLLVHK